MKVGARVRVVVAGSGERRVTRNHAGLSGTVLWGDMYADGFRWRVQLDNSYAVTLYTDELVEVTS